MPKMVARGKGLVHDGRHYNAGDTFDASDVDARYYRRRDMADDAPAVVPPPKTQRAPVAPRSPREQPPLVAEPAPVVAPAAGAAEGTAGDRPDEPSPGATNVLPPNMATAAPYDRRDLRARD